MRVTVTCDECGHRQRVERVIRYAEEFFLICHRCESPLSVKVSAGDIAEARELSRSRR